MEGRGEGGGAGEEPEVVGGGAADEGGGVGVVDGQDAVVGVEEPEEGDAEEAGGVRGLGDTFRDRGLAVFHAAVQDGDLAVGAQGVGGGRFFDAALEAVVEAGDFVPVAEIAGEVEGGDDRVVHLGRACAAEQGQGSQCQECRKPAHLRSGI